MKDVIKARAGSLGGRVRHQLYGNPGTPEGRRLGGLRSQHVHTKRKTAFKTLRTVKKPRRSERLAEFLGILAGDGHVGKYQISVVTNAETDHAHAAHVRELMIALFSVPVSMTKHRVDNALIVLLSSKNVVGILNAFGMPSGNKVKQQIAPPEWISKNKAYTRAYLRGLIDTDGCVYEDRHIVKGKCYSSTCIAFTNASMPLLDFVESTLRQEGFTPTRSGRDIRLRRRKEVHAYTKLIGFNNPKHRNKIRV